MGDHRAHVKIEFTAHGKTYKADMSINYWPEGYSGVDKRILDFFVESWDDALNRYHAEVYESQKEERGKKQRETEMAELKRLKEKYGQD